MDSFKISDKDSFLKMLNLSEDELESIIENKDICYGSYLKIGSGKARRIYRIDRESGIYALQKRLQDLFFCNIYLPDHVYGFRKTYSYLDFLAPHVSCEKARRFLRLDIKNFFDNISPENIKEFFKYYIEDDAESEDADFILNSIIEITTVDGGFPQGAVTSPAVSNFAFRQIDIRIARYCRKLNVIYSRYADDMLFSSSDVNIHSGRFIRAVQAVISSCGFELNHKKTLKYKNEISLNGYVVGDDIRLSRSKMFKLNQLIFDLNSSGFAGFKNKKEEYKKKNKLLGYHSMLIQIYRYTDSEENKAFLQRKIASIEKIIIKRFSV